jgi:hypothetical protein
MLLISSPEVPARIKAAVIASGGGGGGGGEEEEGEAAEQAELWRIRLSTLLWDSRMEQKKKKMMMRRKKKTMKKKKKKMMMMMMMVLSAIARRGEGRASMSRTWEAPAPMELRHGSSAP